jgi:L-fucose isomerase-like protein
VSDDQQLQTLIYNLETSIMLACTIFGREAMALGHREHAINGMGQAIAIAETMTEANRCDMTASMMLVSEFLERDGIREEVFARAAQLKAGH